MGMRVCVVGDSIVNGAGDREGLGWVGRFFQEPLRRNPGLRVYNLGVVRDTSADISARWEQEVGRRFTPEQPRRLAFSFGANDCTTEGADCRVPLAQALANAEAILTNASGLAPTIMIGPIPVLDDPAIDRRIVTLSKAQQALCERIGVPFLPIFDFIRDCAVWREEAAAGDGTHPDSGGYAALADHVARWPAAQNWLSGAQTLAGADAS